MKFGQVENPEEIDFTIPADHADTGRVLAKSKAKDLKIYVGCAKWNKTDLKNFYPKGTKDELGYYSTQFNCIELNATFYRLFPASTFEKWRGATPEGFKFFPKLGQDISHWGRLKETDELVSRFVENASHLQEKLGVPFLGEVPLDLELRKRSDSGEPLMATMPDSPQAMTYLAIARKISESLALGQGLKPAPTITFGA